MELYQLRTLVAVAEEGNFTRAGKRVHATQPAISAHIKALEEELGVQLFHRTPRGVELTVAGSELIADAIDVLAAAEKLQARALTLRGEVVGNFALGLCSDMAFLNVTKLLEHMGKQFPKLNLQLLQLPSGAILSELRAKNLDAGFIFSGNPYSDIQALKLCEPEYFIVGAAKWHKRLREATPEMLSEYTWGMATENSPLREMQLKIFRDHSIKPVQTIGANSEEVIRPLVEEGKALALMREDEATELLESGKGAICSSLGRHPTELNFVHRKSQEDDPAVSALINVVKEIWNI